LKTMSTRVQEYPSINIQKTDYLLEKNGKKWYSLAKYTFN